MCLVCVCVCVCLYVCMSPSLTNCAWLHNVNIDPNNYEVDINLITANKDQIKVVRTLYIITRLTQCIKHT